MPTTFDGVKDGSTLVPCKDATARNDISTINGKIPSAASSSNKLVDTSAMNTAIGNAVSAAYKPAGTKTVAELVSGLLVAANKGNVYNITTAGTTTADFLEGAGKPIRIGDNVGICEPTSGTFKFDLLSGFVAVDENPTASSANPVSSGGVKTALDGKVDKVTGKGLSTNDYDNTAKAVVTTAQDNIIANTKLIKDTVGWSGKNKLRNTANTQTVNGVSFTINNDKSVKANGTATEDVYFNVFSYSEQPMLPIGNYLFSCGVAKTDNYQSYLYERNADNTGWGSAYVDETGNGVEYSRTADRRFSVIIYVKKGATINNVTFYPMLRSADILDDTYEPYFGSTAFPRSEQAVLGAKNLLRPTLTTFTTNGVTFTVNEDKTITVNGTATADIYCPVFNREYAPELSQGSYLVSGGVAETTNYKFYLQERNAANTDWGRAYYDTTGEGVQYDRTTDVRYAVFIWVKSGATLNNVKFYPMITLASDTDRTFAPHVMTNRELTEILLTALFSNPVRLTNANDLDDIKTPGIYSIETSVPVNAPTGMPNTYSCLLVLDTGKAPTQIYIQGGWRGDDKHIAIRGFGGSPSAWSSWRYITDATAS